MGTNYYARVIPTKKRKLELAALLNTDNWNNILNEVHKTYGSFRIECGEPFGGKIHLGKRSGGWKFLWNPNIYIIHKGHTEWIDNEDGSKTGNWIEDPSEHFYLYPLTKEGIKSFIDRPDIEVYDEYGEKQDKDVFFKEALEWTTWRGKEAWDAKSYHEYEEAKGNRLWIPSGNDEYTRALRAEGFEVNWPYSDFYSDGLRFATYNEFS